MDEKPIAIDADFLNTRMERLLAGLRAAPSGWLIGLALALVVTIGWLMWAQGRSGGDGGAFQWLAFCGAVLGGALLVVGFLSGAGAERRSLKLAAGLALKLRQSEARLAEAQHMAGLGNWSVDIELRELQCSEEASALLGFDLRAPAAAYRQFLRTVHEGDKQAIRSLVGAAARQGRGFETELRRFDAEGRLRWLHLVCLPMVNEASEVCLLRGTIMDVTGRKRAELRRVLAQTVTGLLVETDTLALLTPRIIEAVCNGLALDWGVRWTWDAHSESFSLQEGWSAVRAGEQALKEQSRDGEISSSRGELLRRAVDLRAPVVAVESLTDDRKAAREGEVSSAGRVSHAVPIVCGEKVVGAMEFCGRAAPDADEDLLAVLRSVGTQIGLFCDRKEADEARRESEERLHGIVHMAGEAIIAVDHEFKVVLFNPSAERMFGCTAEEALGGGLDRFIPERFQEAHRHSMDAFSLGSPSARKMGKSIDVLGQRANGEEFPVEASISRITIAGKPLYSVVMSDVSARKSSEERLRYLANYDQLTSLPNRNLFNQRLERALGHAKRFNKGLAVLFMDLDRFKNLNDTLGHESGDRVLQSVATRLMACVREVDAVARFGGDEFVVLIEQVADVRAIGAVARKMVKAIDEPFLIGEHEYHVTASMGISSFPADGDDAATLLKSADIAMYRAKEEGMNNVQFYEPAMNLHSIQRLSLESGLRRALQRDEFLLHYQPKVDIASGRVTGMEALVRWNRPETGMVSPAEFIPLAEETGLIVAIGEWVLKAACEQTQKWNLGRAEPLRVAVNLSARQFAQPSLVSDIARILDLTRLPPGALELEITESMVMGNPELAIQTLRQLKSMGIFLSIDDFGTGYSSLGYLKRFPIDHLKIDRSFIKDIPEDNDDVTITRTIIAMAHNLRLKVVAEGVETEAQLNFLREHGCDEMQGYFFSRPLPAGDFSALLVAREAKAALAA